ncbi:MAG TPA: hypothetical protein PKY59_12955 [Pyrinomonadaceae bacterium]|nr:hypothetical protein [Pyrinomonadaceae bacterium]
MDTEKEFSITFEERPEYLYVYVTGKRDSYEISYYYWTKIVEKCRETGWKKVLVEEDIPEVVSIADGYKLASEIAKMGFTGVKVAFFDCYADHLDLNEFTALVAVNRGLYAKVFNDFDEAEKWLNS